MLRSKRLYANLIIFGIFLFVPISPWYLPFFLGIIAAWYMSYYELILLGFLMDVAYGSVHFFTAFSPRFAIPLTVLSAAVLALLHIIKKRIRLQS